MLRLIPQHSPIKEFKSQNESNIATYVHDFKREDNNIQSNQPGKTDKVLPKLTF